MTAAEKRSTGKGNAESSSSNKSNYGMSLENIQTLLTQNIIPAVEQSNDFIFFLSIVCVILPQKVSFVLKEHSTDYNISQRIKCAVKQKENRNF